MATKPVTKTRQKRVARPKPEAIVCGAPDCEVEFTPSRSTAKYHSATCQRRAARARKAAEAAAVVDAKAEAESGPTAEHGLVKATRLELEKAKALDTVDGQIALQLARKLTDPDHVSPGLAKELRASLAAAKGAAVPAPAESAGPAELPEVDEVKQAKERRERKAREAAAGRA